MSLSISITDTQKVGHIFRATGTISVGSGNYSAGGLTLDLRNGLIKAGGIPLRVSIQGRAKQSSQTQYDYTYVPGTNSSDGLMKIFTGGAEAGATTIPSGVTGDTLDFVAEWLFGQS